MGICARVGKNEEDESQRNKKISEKYLEVKFTFGQQSMLR